MKHPLAPQPMSARAGFVKSPLAAIVLLAVATGITGAVYLKHQSAAFRLAAEKSLLSVAALKTGQISDWYSECRLDAEAILQNPMTMTRLRQFLSVPPGTDAAMDIQAWMESRRELRGYHRFVLYDALGVLRLHAPASAPDAEVPALIDNPEFQIALRAGDIRAGDLQPALADSDRFSLDFWVPVASASGANAPALGVVLLDIDPDRALFPLIQSWPTASRTAETLLIRREGNDVVFLNRLRHRANIPLAFRMPIDPKGRLPAAMATLGKEGIVSGRDYRGVPVLAALCGIPGTPWFMVAKEDLAEIDAPLRTRTRVAGGVLLLIFVAAALGVNQLWRRHDVKMLQQQIATEQERRRMEEALQHQQEFARTLLEQMDVGVAACDADGKLSLFNRTARVWHGLDGMKVPPEEWAGYYDLFLEDGQTPMTTQAAPLARAYQGETLHDAGMVLRAKGQPPRQILCNCAPLHDTQGRLLGAVAVMHDITEQRRSEEALMRTAEVLSQSNEEVRQFAYIVSHDLRGPLVNFRGFASELRRSLADLDLLTQPAINQLGDADRAAADRIFHRDVPDALGFIDSSVIRMDHMINALLRLSRLGRHELIPERLDLGSMVAGILASLGSQIEARGATVSVLPLPEVTADRTSLEQILSNILGNAVLYLDPARPGRIDVSGKLSGAELLMKIGDSGRGIAQNDREKVFAPFRRGGAPDVPGEGMGLAYVQALVRRQGGRIWFESEPGVGTTFSFVLPIVRS